MNIQEYEVGRRTWMERNSEAVFVVVVSRLPCEGSLGTLQLARASHKHDAAHNPGKTNMRRAKATLA
jgi:hypothetical protein